MKLEFIRETLSKWWEVEMISEPGDKVPAKVEFSGEKVVYPENIATGSNSYHKLDDDIDISVWNLMFKTPTSVGRKATEETEFYSLHINCSPTQLSHFCDGRKSKMGGTLSSSIFWSTSDIPSCIKVGAGETLSAIVIHMSKQFLQNAVGHLALPAINTNGPIVETANDKPYNVPDNKTDSTIADQKNIVSGSIYTAICEKKYELVQEILNLEQSPSTHDRLLIKANILKILALFIKRIFTKNQRDEKYARYSDATKIFEIRNLIDNHATSEHFSLSYLARAGAISKTKLKIKFKEIIGKTVYQYYLDAKMKKAKSILEDSVVPISDLAYELGFKSISHFSQAFKKHFGVPPSQLLPKEKSIAIAA